MSDLVDDISELSSLSSYLSFPGASSQIQLYPSQEISQVYLDEDVDDVNSVLL